MSNANDRWGVFDLTCGWWLRWGWWTRCSSTSVPSLISSRSDFSFVSVLPRVSFSSSSFVRPSDPLMLVYKAQNGLGPKFTSDLLTHYEPPRPLRPSGTGSQSQIQTWRSCFQLLCSIYLELTETADGLKHSFKSKLPSRLLIWTETRHISLVFI